MDFSGISGAGPRQMNPRIQAQNVAQPLAQQGVALPTDRVGLKSKSGPSNPFSPEKRLSDLKPEELSKLGGGTALETLASKQGNLTIGEAAPLLRNQPALDSIANLMSERSDLKVSDFVSTDIKGKVTIDPSYKDEEAMAFLKERQDVQPGEVSSMRANFTKKFQNPRMGKEATAKGLKLMKQRRDIGPNDVGKLMDSLGMAAGMDGKNSKGKPSESAGQATLDMFDSASKLLVKRTDMGPDSVGEMAGAVGKLGSPKDPNRSALVAQGFDAATKALEQNPLRNTGEMTALASTIGNNFKGQDEKTAGIRMNAFATGAKMMGKNTEINADSIGSLLQQAKKKNPKMGDGSGPKGAQKLSNVLTDVASGVSKGTVSPENLSSYFQTPEAQSAGFKPTAKPGEQKQGEKAADKQTKGSDPAGEEAKKTEVTAAPQTTTAAKKA